MQLSSTLWKTFPIDEYSRRIPPSIFLHGGHLGPVPGHRVVRIHRLAVVVRVDLAADEEERGAIVDSRRAIEANWKGLL